MSGVVRIGVTGHRILTEVDKVVAGMVEGINAVEAAFPGKTLEVVSPLAEGADRLVAQEVPKRPGARLVVPLPLPVSDYLTDFGTAESRAEFHCLLGRAAEVIELPPHQTREAAYEAVGIYVLDHCDVLVAVWDGQGPQGQGGTGGIVAEARRRGLPLVWVHAGNRKPGTVEPTTLGESQGRVVLERLSP
jgi:hypothetical protein